MPLRICVGCNAFPKWGNEPLLQLRGQNSDFRVVTRLHPRNPVADGQTIASSK
jgi:hypothetical protein